MLPPTKLPWAVGVAHLVLLLGCVGFAASTVLRSEPGHIGLLDAWLYDSLTVTAALIITARCWLVAVERRAWMLVAMAMGSLAAADVVYTTLVAGSEATSPSIADPFYLVCYPLMYLALVLLMRARVRQLPAAVWLDGLIAGLALASVTTALVFGPISAATGGSRAAVIVALAYPLGDLLLLTVAAAALAILGWRAQSQWLFLAAGLSVFAIAHVFYLWRAANNSYVEGTWIDALWPVAGLLIAWASWRPTRQIAARQLQGRVALVPPLLCTGVATTVLMADHDLGLPRLAAILAAGTLLSVATRLALTCREVSRLAITQRQAVTDDLTGVANRRALMAALERCASAYEETTAASDGSTPPLGPGLLLVDLDGFKEVNDSLGHHVGDELLRQLSARLAHATRPGDLVARLGGDEFAVLVSRDTDLGAAESVAVRLFDALAAPFGLDDVTLHVQASIGIALCPNHCQDPMNLLQRADVAMYTAKRTHSRIAVYHTSDDRHSRARLQAVEDVRLALTRGELTCHYQPKVSLLDGSVHSVEALVRWKHPTRGLLLPGKFLPLVEQTRLIHPLTLVVMDLALSQARSWRDLGMPLAVAVNLPATSLLDSELPADVRRLLDLHDLPADALILEITESVLMNDTPRARAALADIHDLGIGLSIDDYGTGYSSLAYLQDLPVNELKLDQAFISRLTTDSRSAAIVRSTVNLAHSLGMRIVAEGVENAATVEALQRDGCDISQGYHHSRPLPAEELTHWLRNQPLATTAQASPAATVAS